MLLSELELDLCPKFNSGRPGLNLGQRFTVDPAWAFALGKAEILYSV